MNLSAHLLIVLSSLALSSCMVMDEDPSIVSLYSERSLDSSAFSHDGGFAYVYPMALDIPSDSNSNPNASTLRVFEDGIEMGPAHTLHATIRSTGEGRFSHKNDQLRLSASDNSDPRTNGRNYVVTTGETPSLDYLNSSAFSHDGGFAYIYPMALDIPSDSNSNPNASTLRVFEDGIEMGPAHTLHATIRSTGEGRFSHKNDQLRLSASDNSDPRTNGRNYIVTTGEDYDFDAPMDNSPGEPIQKLPTNSSINFNVPQRSTLSGTDPSANQSRPSYLSRVAGVHSSLDITRVTPTRSFGQHSYSKRQAWNANETLLNVGRRILNANTYQEVDTHPFSSERVWSNNDPDVMFGIKFSPKANHFVKYNTRTKQQTALRAFNNYEKCTLGDYEGSQSLNDQYIVFACEDSSQNKTLISYDINNNSILGTLRAANSFNWASVTLSGRYILVENNAPGDPNDGQLLAYSKTFQSRRVLYDVPRHGDISMDDEGNDIMVMTNWNSITYIRVNDGVQVSLGATNRIGGGHISCRNIKRPGWCYFSTRDQNQRIGAIRVGIKPNASRFTDDNGDVVWEGLSQVELWGHSKSSFSTYENQAKATVSPSGSRIIFSSNWATNLNQNSPHPSSATESHEYVIRHQP